LRRNQFVAIEYQNEEETLMKWLLTALATLVFFTATCGVHPTRGGDKEPKDNSGSLWMKQKLVASQNILAGLTKADYEQIEKNAQSMIAVGYLEKWIRADTPEYQTMLRNFLYSNKSLSLAAREKNLEGATVAYLQLTLSCVNCHKLVRDTRK
jgi:hypothetical protein